jgi:hypothetical protein
MTEIRSLTDLAEYAQDQIDRITRMQQQLNDYVGEGESPRCLVHARTGPGGRVLDLRLSPDTLRLSPEGTAEEITARSPPPNATTRTAPTTSWPPSSRCALANRAPTSSTAACNASTSSPPTSNVSPSNATSATELSVATHAWLTCLELRKVG